MRSRRGHSLVEVLIVIAILAVLIGLALGAIQKTRVRAVHVQSLNNLRQIALGLHGYAAAKQGMLPGAKDPVLYNSADGGALYDIVGYIDGQVPRPSVRSVTRPDGSIDGERLHPRRAVYISPGDPTAAVWDSSYLQSRPDPKPDRCPDPPTSYAENMTAFTGPPSLAVSFPDGTSNTIAFAERYTIGNRFEKPSFEPNRFSYKMGGPAGPITRPNDPDPDLGGWRRPTFADRGWRDVHPVMANGVTRASVAGRTFQVRPLPAEADGSVVQTPFAAGLPVTLFDGSVRTVSPRVSEEAFWAAVTPAGGDAGPLD